MLANNATQLFESVARSHPQLREWLQAEYERNVKSLVQLTDSEQMRRVQGHAQCLSGIIERLDKSLAPRGATGSPRATGAGS